MFVDSEDTKHRKERRLRPFRTEVLHIGRRLRRIGWFVARAHLVPQEVAKKTLPRRAARRATGWRAPYKCVENRVVSSRNQSNYVEPATWSTHPKASPSPRSEHAPPCGGHSAACRGRRPVAATSAAALRRMRRRRGAAPMAGGAQEPSSLRNDRLPSMPMRNMRPLPLARARACDSSDRVCVCPVPCLSSRSCFERSI